MPGSGILKTESPPVAGAKVVNLRGVGELHITQGPTTTCCLYWTPKLQGEVLTLAQRSNENLKPTRGIVYKLDSSGVGSFEGKGLEGDAITVSISGAGSTTVNATNTLDANVSGTGSVTYFGVGSINPG